ncbi:MAG TPA: hypothetical protein VEA80_09410 [Vitreimonas sp.]|uniref:hypothetical protein n=1 Tax=Vitreimonas sp. TaxID=3069702 RepID=UPI002D38CF28|nr:hypothetical protein [Vitreimonas sp.]HYD87680.1 hypothetical protein [Vitreimonas sp.]
MAKNLLIALALIALSAMPSAQAQTAQNGLGPYTFGMSSAEVRATAPNAAWSSRNQDGGEILSGGPRVEIGGRFDARLVFTDSQLQRIVLVGLASAPCATAVPTMVEALEPLHGPLTSMAPPSLERGVLKRTQSTEAGSEIRVLGIEGRPDTTVSARHGATSIIVQGVDVESRRCQLTIVFGSNADWRRPDSGGVGPSWTQLDAAQSLVEPNWAARPNAYSFTRHYPQGALERTLDGEAVVDCLVVEDGRLSCIGVEETPVGEGFAQAAASIARDYRVRRGRDGTPAIGRRVRVLVRFNAEGP